MKYSIAAAGIFAVVAAQNPSAVSELSVLNSQLSSAATPPQSIAAELITAVPSAVIAAFGNPSAIPALASSLEASPPAWYSSLPADAKSWIAGVEQAYATLEPQIASLEAIVSGYTGPASAAPTGSPSSTAVKSTSSGYSNSTIASTKSSSSTAGTTKATTLTSSASAASSSKAASSSSSSGGAASPTGAVAAGVMGAVGILGLALAL